MQWVYFLREQLKIFIYKIDWYSIFMRARDPSICYSWVKPLVSITAAYLINKTAPSPLQAAVLV